MELAELTPDQRRRLVDATQAFEAWREGERDFRHGFHGTMRWKTVNGKQYLYRVFGKVGQSLGRIHSQPVERNVPTPAIKALSFQGRKTFAIHDQRSCPDGLLRAPVPQNRKVQYSRIGRAYPHGTGQGLTVIFDARPLKPGPIILLELDGSDDRRLAAQAKWCAREERSGKDKPSRHGG